MPREKAAAALIQAASEQHPPEHLLLGSDAYQAVTAKMHALLKKFSEWESRGRSTDFASSIPAETA